MEKKIDVDEVRNRRMTDHITPEELRRLVSARYDEPTVRDAMSMAAATIEALQAKRDGLAATLEQVRAWLAYKPTASLHDIVAAAPSVSLAHVKAETLREAAAAFTEGEEWQDAFARVAGDDDVDAVRATEEWLIRRADQIESEASNE